MEEWTDIISFVFDRKAGYHHLLVADTEQPSQIDAKGRPFQKMLKVHAQSNLSQLQKNRKTCPTSNHHRFNVQTFATEAYVRCLYIKSGRFQAVFLNEAKRFVAFNPNLKIIEFQSEGISESFFDFIGVDVDSDQIQRDGDFYHALTEPSTPAIPFNRERVMSRGGA